MANILEDIEIFGIVQRTFQKEAFKGVNGIHLLAPVIDSYDVGEIKKWESHLRGKMVIDGVEYQLIFKKPYIVTKKKARYTIWVRR